MPFFDADSLIPARYDPRLDPDLVVRSLAPVLSEARRRRVERVLRHRLLSVTVVLENLHDPHNGAAALRTCEAMGLHHVHVVSTGEPFAFSRKVSVNAHKWLAVFRHDAIDGCLGYLRRSGFACWAAMPPPLDRPPAGQPVAVDRPVALVFGNEHAGLTAQARELCERCFSVPMHGFSESLNLSVSVAVTLREVTAHRRRTLGRPGDLPRSAMAQLRAAYYAQSTRHAVPLVARHLGLPG